LQPRGKKRKTMINMRTASRRVMNSYKHKRCKMKTTKIKITTIRRVTSSYNQDEGKGR
jgi:uncharacterized protein YhfF